MSRLPVAGAMLAAALALPLGCADAPPENRGTEPLSAHRVIRRLDAGVRPSALLFVVDNHADTASAEARSQLAGQLWRILGDSARETAMGRGVDLEVHLWWTAADAEHRYLSPLTDTRLAVRATLNWQAQLESAEKALSDALLSPPPAVPEQRLLADLTHLQLLQAGGAVPRSAHEERLLVQANPGTLQVWVVAVHADSEPFAGPPLRWEPGGIHWKLGPCSPDLKQWVADTDLWCSVGVDPMISCWGWEPPCFAKRVRRQEDGAAACRVFSFMYGSRCDSSRGWRPVTVDPAPFALEFTPIEVCELSQLSERDTERCLTDRSLLPGFCVPSDQHLCTADQTEPLLTGDAGSIQGDIRAVCDLVDE